MMDMKHRWLVPTIALVVFSLAIALIDWYHASGVSWGAAELAAIDAGMISPGAEGHGVE